MDIGRLRGVARRIVEAALAAADPAAAVRRSLAATPRGFTACAVEHPLPGRLLVVAVGKAAPSMAGGALAVLGDRVSEGIVVVPHGYPSSIGGEQRANGSRGPRIEVVFSSHPVPDSHGLAAARRVVELFEGMSESDTCLFLLSGGSSSLLPLPSAPVSLGDKVEATRLLLESGADIREINTVRKHLSDIKGGRLAARARGRVVSLLISDVVGDPAQFIGSGPTVPDSTTFTDARDVLARYSLIDRVPSSVVLRIGEGVAGRVPETPKSLPGRHAVCLVASNRLAVESAMREASALGFAPLLLTASLTGEAREAGRLLACIAREARQTGRPAAPPACIVAGGETTVTIRGKGKGGRNQEIALAAAIELAGETGILLASFATDGKEGNTDAAGAFASGETVAAGRCSGLDPQACLAANDSNAFLSAAGELLVTGPTGTNVNDLTFALVERRS
jgi:glycerate-2-kinase